MDYADSYSGELPVEKGIAAIVTERDEVLEG